VGHNRAGDNARVKKRRRRKEAERLTRKMAEATPAGAGKKPVGVGKKKPETAG
jgi:hypothetical protein